MRRLHSHDPFGSGAVALGIFALWALLAGDAAPSTLGAAGAVAAAAIAWARLIEP